MIIKITILFNISCVSDKKPLYEISRHFVLKSFFDLV